ncbi:MAG: hypothetical protein Q8L84_12075 [Hyphomonas sp.]|nr:hypothetical protein [Hyphomonas sp.]
MVVSAIAFRPDALAPTRCSLPPESATMKASAPSKSIANRAVPLSFPAAEETPAPSRTSIVSEIATPIRASPLAIFGSQ